MISQKEIQTPYLSYSYSYPHKTAYRLLQEPIAIRDAWKNESTSALFLYMHIPFCEMRCGFCNLFTMTNSGSDLETAYVRALRLQANVVRDELAAHRAEPRFARAAIGGGTPTFLSVEHLSSVLDIAETTFAINFHDIPCSIETSPLTSELEKLSLLRDRGISRISIGVQSFIDDEVKAVGRSQTAQQVHAALQRIKSKQFPVLNIDLIYGIPNQTAKSWLYSLNEAVKYQPEEVYLYPLYVRPLTGLGRKTDSEAQNREIDSDSRLELYRIGKEFLLSKGYEQCSMRMFRLPQNSANAGPVYCCQTDGMVGIGCGSRSYTSTLHYSDQYAVSAKSTKSLIEEYVSRNFDSFKTIEHGVELNRDEQKRRFVIQSLLQLEGLSFSQYRNQFNSDALSDFYQLTRFIDEGSFQIENDRMVITNSGLELSDSLGVALYSPDVRNKMSEYQMR